jgi:5-methylcytosine-specific restriction endonuclease McrA
MQRDCWICQVCKREGRITPATECDHIKPKAEGGSDDPVNLQAICKACHAVKSAAEGAKAQGRTVKPRLTIGEDGWPVE